MTTNLKASLLKESSSAISRTLLLNRNVSSDVSIQYCGEKLLFWFQVTQAVKCHHLSMFQSQHENQIQQFISCFYWFPGSLDLPPVNVTAQRDAKILFRFMHPWLLYYKNSHVTGKKQKRNNHSPQIGNIPAFEYIVTMDEVRGSPVPPYIPSKDC